MIPAFGAVGFCPKCGGNTSNCVSREFRGGIDKKAAVGQYDGLDKEYMVVRCRGCRYGWYERPRDYKEPNPSPTIEELAKREVDAIAPEGEFFHD